mmetsp:Transcript_38030/g.122084  ORF Transcript_38030/g.122084 Transcript_38030/m.122084 type:complete len:325 (-) Transcript_38030:2196-3170(-)
MVSFAARPWWNALLPDPEPDWRPVLPPPREVSDDPRRSRRTTSAARVASRFARSGRAWSQASAKGSGTVPRCSRRRSKRRNAKAKAKEASSFLLLFFFFSKVASGRGTSSSSLGTASVAAKARAATRSSAATSGGWPSWSRSVVRRRARASAWYRWISSLARGRAEATSRSAGTKDAASRASRTDGRSWKPLDGKRTRCSRTARFTAVGTSLKTRCTAKPATKSTNASCSASWRRHTWRRPPSVVRAAKKTSDAACKYAFAGGGCFARFFESIVDARFDSYGFASSSSSSSRGYTTSKSRRATVSMSTTPIPSPPSSVAASIRK